jgi:3-hydroxyacyl-CoA dehydrogenase / enoyl-CoA hydratase / 3-hydroxybutyryl-CoA epimerase
LGFETSNRSNPIYAKGNNMTATPPALEQFRIELQPNGIVHFIFDCPNRTMNVFSNAAIHELGVFAEWVAGADVKGVLVRSGKDNAFCAGADLIELGVAYDMIMQAPPHARFQVAYDHFFPLSKAVRALETAGKPVACAIGGIALGGGCELTMGAHYRVLVDNPKIVMGLPESLVGLLPGAGGTQRAPRLVGMETALSMLLNGLNLSGQAALDAGLVDELVAPGEEVARAEAWLLSNPVAVQPWDRADWQSPSTAEIAAVIAPLRAKADPHYPAPIAILDCVQYGLPQTFEGAIRSEMSVFSYLIQRPEPRNMIQTMFLGKTDYDKAARKGELPAAIEAVVAAAKAASTGDYEPQALQAISAAVAPFATDLSAAEKRMADYAVVSQTGYPAFLGGPFTFLAEARD